MSFEVVPTARLESVSKIYDRMPSKMLWREALGIRHRPTSPVVALDAVSLEVLPGESVGLVGANGAGKSTALRLLARVTEPTKGTVTVPPHPRALIEIGNGFHPDLDGRQNAISALALLGYSTRAAEAAIPEVADFAQLGSALSAPIRHYSTGMAARLAFAVATHQPAALFVIDEILAVGDRDFQSRCIQRIHELVGQGSALVFVSHDMNLVSSMCERAIQLRHGHMADEGPTDEVIRRYLGTTSNRRHHVDPVVSIRSLSGPSHIGAQSTFVIDMALDVRRAVTSFDIRVEILQPAESLEVVIADHRSTVDWPLGIGQFHLCSRPISLPVSGAYFRFRISVLPCDESGEWDSHEIDMSIGSAGTGLHTQFDPAIQFTITELDADGAELPNAVNTGQSRTDPVVSISRATKVFRGRYVGQGGPKDEAVRRERRATCKRQIPGTFRALDDVSFDIAAGEAVGIIGPNGAGKSTILKAIANILALDSGSIRSTVDIVPMLDIAPGTDPDMSGIENARFLATLYGYGPGDFESKQQQIFTFADLGDAPSAPIRTYSSGMHARLGFAVALFAPGDIVLIDELLSVGDEQFRRKALTAIEERRKSGSSVLFVSHDLSLVAALCERVIRLNQGRIIADGDAHSVLGAYAGQSGDSGAYDATEGISVSPIRLRSRNVLVGGTLRFSANVLVSRPDDDARMEITYRARIGDRVPVESSADRYAITILAKTVVERGGRLSRTGSFRLDATISDHHFNGEVDVTVAIIDERDGKLLAESWHQVTVGEPAGDFPRLALDLGWELPSAT